MDHNHLIISDNLSVTWAQAFLSTIQPGVKEIQPLTMVISDFEYRPDEVPEICCALDMTLSECNRYPTESTANTMFPLSAWNPDRPSEEFYARYIRILPRIKKKPINRHGTYFERLIAYGETQENQLKYIVDTYRGGLRRRSAFQAAIYDPLRDQSKQPRRGFPCLQQIAFIPNASRGDLSVHGFYANQLMFERAYGNLMGLARLGYFIGHELDLRLTKIVCTAAIAQYGDVNRAALRNLRMYLDSLFK